MRAAHFIAAGVAVGIAAALYKAQDIRAALATVGPEYSNLHPEVQTRAAQVLAAADAEFSGEGVKVGIYEGWRDPSTQAKRIEAGASGVATPLESYHPWGLAVDFVFIDRLGRWTWLPDPKNPNNKAYVDPKWNRLGALIESAGFEWGGRWRNFDGPHAQFPVVRTAQLRASFTDPIDYVRTFANV